MVLKKWENLPEEFKNDRVKTYYAYLEKKKASLVVKRILDLIFSLILLIIFSPFFLIIGLMIKLDTRGPIFFRQERVTQYGRKFKIFKFRTMVVDAAKLGGQVTIGNDPRITRVGKLIRKLRLDEICQVINILLGDMTFVGTRPEVPRYVDHYSQEMMATLLLPAGVTSRASVEYKDEASLLDRADDLDRVYIEEILPEKMKYNLEDVINFSISRDISIIFFTIKEVFFGS